MTSSLAEAMEGVREAPWPDWFTDWRAAQRSHHARNGIPTARLENWKYTSLRAFADTAAAPEPSAVAGEDLGEFTFTGAAGRLVFVDGHFRADLSDLGQLPAGLEVSTLAQAGTAALEPFAELLVRDYAAPDESLAALAGGSAADGAVIRVRRGAAPAAPLHLLLVSTGSGLGSLHVLLRVDDGAALELLEQHVSLGPSEGLFNVLLTADVGPGARLRHHRLQECGDGAGLVTRTEVLQRRDARYRYLGCDLGGRVVRHDLHCRLEAPGSEAELLGMYALAGRRLVDNHTRVDHVAPVTRSDEHFKGVLDGASRGVFNGKVVVHPGAARIDAQQVNRNLLLSERAEIDTKPELEIYADDVKCAHGATVGQLDASQLYYLRSRGIPEAEARGMLVEAFCREIIDRADPEGLRDWLEARVAPRLPRGGEAVTGEEP